MQSCRDKTQAGKGQTRPGDSHAPYSVMVEIFHTLSTAERLGLAAMAVMAKMALSRRVMRGVRVRDLRRSAVS